MRSDSLELCPLCAGGEFTAGPDGQSECSHCGWIDESSLVDISLPATLRDDINPGHAPLSVGLRAYSKSDLNSLSLSQRGAARRLRRIQTWEDRRVRSETEDKRVGFVVSFLRNLLLSEHDACAVSAFAEMASVRLKDLRRLESETHGVRLFRNGCEFGVEAMAVCIMELMDRENGVLPPDTKRRIAHISYLHSLDAASEKKFRSAIKKTRRAIKGLLCQGMRKESRPKGVWDAPVASSCRSAEVRMSQINTIVERRISDSGVLGWSDRSRLMEICGSILKRLDETESSHVRLSTVVEMGVLTLGRERRPGDPLRKIVEDMGISKTALNHTSKLPTVAPAA